MNYLKVLNIFEKFILPPSTGEQNEEIRIEYRFDDVNCSTGNKDCNGCQERQVYSCYGSPNHGDEKKSEEHIVQFSSEDLSGSSLSFLTRPFCS